MWEVNYNQKYVSKKKNENYETQNIKQPKFKD